MKNKDIERKIKSSFKPAKERVWKTVENSVFQNDSLVTGVVAETGSGNKVLSNKRNVLISVVGVFVALVVALCFLLPTFKKNPSLDFSGSFYIDINPSIQVNVDKDGLVTSVLPLNQDALVLLGDDYSSDMIGSRGEDVAVSIWELAYNTGYISPLKQNNAVLVTGSLSNQSLNQILSEKIRNNLTKITKDKGVYCVVLTDKYDSSLDSEASKYGITSSKYQLILDAIYYGADILEAEYSEISITDINERVAKIGKNLAVMGDKNFHDDKQQVDENISQAIIGIKDKLNQLKTLCQDKPFYRVDDLIQKVDEIENAISLGVGIKERFFDLKGSLSMFNMIIQQEIKDCVADIETMIDEVVGQISNFDDKINNKKNEIRDKHHQQFESAMQEIQNHIKDMDFDNSYEDWLDSVYEDYKNDWNSKREQWQSSRQP